MRRVLLPPAQTPIESEPIVSRVSSLPLRRITCCWAKGPRMITFSAAVSKLAEPCLKPMALRGAELLHTLPRASRVEPGGQLAMRVKTNTRSGIVSVCAWLVAIAADAPRAGADKRGGECFGGPRVSGGWAGQKSRRPAGTAVYGTHSH